MVKLLTERARLQVLREEPLTGFVTAQNAAGLPSVPGCGGQQGAGVAVRKLSRGWCCTERLVESSTLFASMGLS